MRKSQKLRRHSGRRRGRIIESIGKENIIEQCLEPQEYWDDWKDYRDGFRGCKDRKLLRSKFMSFANNFDVERWNKKLKNLIQVRYARKVKERYLREF